MRKQPAIEPEVRPAEPVEIRPLAIYYLADLQRLGLRASTVRREHRLGRLRIAKRGGRILVLGEWLVEWVWSGEIKARCHQKDRAGFASPRVHNGSTEREGGHLTREGV